MQQFHVRFEPARNGWLPVTIEAAHQRLAFEASFTPPDSLAQLIDTLLVVLSSDGTRSVTWYSEPVEYTFTFVSAADVVALIITTYPDYRRDARMGRNVLTIQADRTVLVRSFWRALRRIETQDDFVEQWRRPFPHDALAQLRAIFSASRAV